MPTRPRTACPTPPRPRSCSSITWPANASGSSASPSTSRGRSSPTGRTRRRRTPDLAAVTPPVAPAGTQPPPGPGWVISAADLSHLRTAAPVVSTRFFDTPRTFVTGVGPTALGALGMPTAVPTQSFASAGALISAVDTGRLRPGTRAVVYAAAHSGSTPLAEQRHLARFYRLAGQAAHAHGLLFIAAPAANLVAALAPHTPASRQDSAFLRLRIAAQAAPSADVYVAETQSLRTS